MRLTLPEIVTRHCAAEKNVLTKAGYISATYGVTRQFFESVAHGQKKPSARLLNALSQAHVRLFPNAPVTLDLPNHPPVLLGQPSDN